MLCALILGLASCSSAPGKGGKAPAASSIGQPAEVLLVLDKDVMASSLKDSLKTLLECEVPGLNQSEAYFRVSRVPASIYRGEMLKMHSRLFVKVDESLPESAIRVAYDVDAAPQIHVQVAGPSVEELKSFLQGHADKVRQLLVDFQLKMQRPYLIRHASKSVSKELKTMGYEGYLPEEIAWTKKGAEFIWGSSRSYEKQLNFVFYRYPSDGSEPKSVERMVQLRDSVMQCNIPGSEPGQWMETVWEGGQPVVLNENRIMDGRPVSILRGLWQMRNGAMGGPFVSYSWYDEDAGLMVVAEGFVYSPSTEKRDLVRRLEAGLRTIRKLR